jgi:hypothetical protein
MHTIRIIVGGFVLLAVCLLLGKVLSKGGNDGLLRAAKLFVPLWLVAGLVNMWIGVTQAGYTVTQEAPILALVLAPPIAAALLMQYYFSRH